MENARRSEKNRVYWNHNASINGLLVIVMVLFSVCHIAQANHAITIDCSALKRCQKCTSQGSSCVWSLERQACFADYGKKLSLAVRKKTDCPRVTSVTRVTYAAYLPYVYKVQVSNDVTEFMAFLEDVQVSCVILDVTRPAQVFNDTISCAPVDKSDLGFDHQRLMTYHCYVTFGDGDTILRLDDSADSYFAVYEEFYYGYPMDAESCVACVWDVGHYAYHYKWCSSRNVATGRYLYYVGYSDTDRNATMPADDRLTATVPASSGCEDVRVRSVEPSSALWTGDVRISMTVSNHSILADGGEVRVTAAGRACARPMSTVRGTGVTCVLTAPGPGEVRPRTAYVSGPVIITYGASSLTVESAPTFRLVYPEITDVSPSCGPLTGGTLLTVRGRQLNAGSLVTVTVAAAEDGESPSTGSSSVPCEVVARYVDRILCLTGPSDRAAVGVVRALFDGKLRVQDGPDGPLTFTYGAEPALAAGQRFEGIASGGTAAPVRGTGFTCVSDAVMYVDRDGVRRLAASHCRPVNDTFMVCGTPRLDGPTGAGDSPERLRFGFHVRHADGHVSDMPPQPDTDGYVAHSDPVLVDFSVSAAGRTVMISGLDLGRGYQAADVTVVEFANNLSSVACNVTAITRSHIVCKTALPSDLHGTPALVVTIGDRFTRTVNSTAYRSPSFGILFFVTVLVLIALVYYCYYKSKSVIVPRFGFANTM